MIKWHVMTPNGPVSERGLGVLDFDRTLHISRAKGAEKFLAVAQAMKAMSKDPSTQVGAVALSVENNILASSYNGFPRGVEDDPELYADRAQKYPRIIHAEANLVAAAARVGVSLKNSLVILTSLHPCSQCAGLLVQAGATTVVAPLAPENARWDNSNAIAYDILRQGGVTLVLYET